MAAGMKTDRLDLRMTTQQKNEIERAAAISGRSVTDFSVSVLVHEAGEVIQRERDLVMSQQAWDAFNEAIDQPARTVDGLAHLLKQRSVFVD